MSETCGKRLAKAMKVAGNTKWQIAMGAGITRSMMDAYLKDIELPTHEEATRIAELLGTTASWLIHGTHPGKPRL